MADVGVLYIAHGSKDKRWVEQIDRAVAQVQLSFSSGKASLPFQIGFLENVSGRSIAEALGKLEQEVERVIVLPLFICSGSTHLEEIQYSLGLLPTSRIATDLALVKSKAKLIWGYPMDDHPYMAQIVLDRVAALTEQPKQHAILFVAHGSEHAGFKEIWQEKMTSLVSQVERELSPQEVDLVFLSSGLLEQKAREMSAKYQLPIIIIPLFVSPGYFTSKHIPKHLAGIHARYAGEVFLPHSLVSEWMKEQLEEILRTVEV